MAICGTAAACRQHSAGSASSFGTAAAARPRSRRPRNLRQRLFPKEETLPGACHAAATDSSGGFSFGLAARARPVDIAIEPGPHNSRCIWAGVDVAAPQQAVWEALTSYERLRTFVPGLAENRCLERYPDGCKLLQVGRQDLALGLRFCARVCLRITEHPAGVPPHLLARGPNSRDSFRSGTGGGSDTGPDPRSGGSNGWGWPFGGVGMAAPGSGARRSAGAGPGAAGGWEEGEDRQLFSEQRFLRPRSPLGQAAAMDVSFQLVEGDFSAFKGLWRVQSAGAAASRLSYTLFVRPQPWLLVGLIEQRVQDEISANLAAVKAYVEHRAAA